jgi:hypothetical protein
MRNRKKYGDEQMANKFSFNFFSVKKICSLRKRKKKKKNPNTRTERMLMVAYANLCKTGYYRFQSSLYECIFIFFVLKIFFFHKFLDIIYYYYYICI